MKVYGSTDIALPLLNFGVWCRRVVYFTLRPLYPRKRTPVSIEQEAGCATLPVWTIWRR